MTAALESVGQSAVVQEQTAERGVQEQERGVVLFGANIAAWCYMTAVDHPAIVHSVGPRNQPPRAGFLVLGDLWEQGVTSLFSGSGAWGLPIFRSTSSLMNTRLQPV